ncbi:MAG: 3-deoxy-8-phosphooctulonate synthase [Fimbriimonadaceae bacterium]|nr:3-deoxy-8-phosphooctulonate synthase [Chitinophagales bacterium]
MFQKFKLPVQINSSITVGEKKPLLIAGPCVIESEALCLEVAEYMKNVSAKLGYNYIFKASFDKANRTSGNSFRGEGIENGLKILQTVKQKIGVPVLTDIHLPAQAKIVAEVADVLQIPAFLCRQTDLLIAAGETGKAINVKKGQFMAPEDMQYAVEKILSTNNHNILLTERGTSFGYHNLVVDMRSLPIMRQYAPVIFDVTHSVQMPGGNAGKSGGKREFASYLAKAAAASGVDGFFIETHPDPENALSDGPNMIPLTEMEHFLNEVFLIYQHSA